MNKRLRELRKDILSLTLKKFGEEIGLSPGAIGDIESARTPLQDRHIKLICQTFNVNEEWLRNGIEPIFKEDSNKYNDIHINELINKYDINSNEIDIIKRLVNLDKTSRNKILDFMFDMVKENIDKIDADKILKFAKEPPDKVKIVARGKGVTYEDADRINKIIENAEDVDLDDIDFL